MMSAANRILVVGDDSMLRDLLLEQLSLTADLEPIAIARGGLARDAVRDDGCELVLIDAILPDMEARDLVTAIREDGFRGPIVMLGSALDEPEPGNGPETGAPEFVAKPFRFAVLLARIRAQLRAQEASEEASVPIGHYTFRAGAKTLTSDASGLLRLTEKEAAILRFLHRAGEITVSRDTLLQEVWGYNASVSTHTLETHIYRLRQKIEIDPADAKILVTEPGGYRLMV